MVCWLLEEGLGFVNREGRIMRINTDLSNFFWAGTSTCARIALEAAKHGEYLERSKLDRVASVVAHKAMLIHRSASFDSAANHWQRRTFINRSGRFVRSSSDEPQKRAEFKKFFSAIESQSDMRCFATSAPTRKRSPLNDVSRKI